MATITIDGKSYEVDSSKNLLEVCLSLGLNLPYFCWHPAMHSVGACRQCAVKQFRGEEDEQGALVMACMTPAADGTRISLQDPEAVEFRASVIEWLMVNHPHDCPICDEGGECHLQDMTVMTGHSYRRYRFRKRTYRNQYLGPFINHEMNRCIQCYRCVRFYRDFADGRDFDVFGAHDHVYFGRHQDGVLESEFSGNLVEICPTGVFTDKTLKEHYTRKWDLQTAPSICMLCGVGCNTIPGERYGGLRRIRNRYNRQVNGYFLCDRGRYGYEFVNSEQRVRRPQVRRPGDEAQAPASREEIVAHLRQLLGDGSGMVGIGSPRASLEGNYALRTLVGEENFFSGASEQDSRLVQAALETMQGGPARTPSLRDIAKADAVVVLGEDLTNTAPMLAYAVRQAVRNRPRQKAADLNIPLWNEYAVREVVQEEKGPLFVASLAATKLDDVATRTYRATPGDVARLAFALAHALDGEAPPVADLPAELEDLVQEMAQALREAERPVVISGTSSGSEALLQGAANVAWALCKADRKAGLCFVMPEANSAGLGLMGAGDLQAARKALAASGGQTLVILENDLYRRAPAEVVEELLGAAQQVIVLDHLDTPTTKAADVILPAATFAEGDGTVLNNEGRAQRYLQVFVPEGEITESWRWLQEMAVAAGRGPDLPWQELDGVMASLAEALPVFAAVPEIAPPSEFRVAGQKIPRQPHRYSGRTAMLAHINVSEPKPPDDPDTALSFSMEGFKGEPPAPLLPRYWAPGWNSVQALNKFQDEVGGPLHGGDPGRRLIGPDQEGPVTYFDGIPSAFRRRQGQWRLVPLYHIFGSEPLSMLTPGVAELAPAPYVALHPDDAEELAVAEGTECRVQVGGPTPDLPVRPDPSLPRGVAGLPVGLPGLPPVALPVWARISTTEGVQGGE